jgi:hypothetical protein
MPESRELQNARRSLSRAEDDLRSAAGVGLLAEGLGLLEDVIAAGTVAEARTARNLATTYASRIYERVAGHVGRDGQVPEPELERYFKVMLAFDRFADALPPKAAELKIAVVRALVERYYEGHPPEKKRAALAQLESLQRR